MKNEMKKGTTAAGQGGDVNNYEVMRQNACRRFMTFDQEDLLDRFPLKHDQDDIWVSFLDREYRISRSSGQVSCGDRTANMEETLSIFDMICRSGQKPSNTGSWVTLTDLASGTGTGPVSMDMFRRKTARYEGKMDLLRDACRKMGGSPVKGGDVSFLLPVFEGFYTWFQYWDADDEFSSEVRFLWDATTPAHLHYETLWYIMGTILERLEELSPTGEGAGA